MSAPDSAAPPDLLGEAVTLIRDVGACAQRARRYRVLVTTIAEPLFDRALAIGSEIRRGGRGSDPEAVVVPAIRELRELLTLGNAAIIGVQSSEAYRKAAASFAAGRVTEVTPLALSIFAGVALRPAIGPLYWPVPLGQHGSGEHFITPDACAHRIHQIATDGLSAGSHAPDLGGDEAIRPILLNEDHDGSESPIALALDAEQLPSPLARLEGSTLTLVYAERVRATFTVNAVAGVSDEWWRIRPDAYRRYLDELGGALTARGLALVVEP